jgi:phosphoglycerate dehydrogenase-like enzyme
MRTMTNALFVLDPSAFELVYGTELQHEIARRARLVGPPQTRAALASDPARWREVEVIFSGWGAPTFDEHVLALFSNLRAVFYGAGSIREIVTPAFWARDIVITTAATANAVPVADYTLATILFSLKHGWHHALGAKCLGRFPLPTVAPGGYRSRVGLISLGTIGRLVRERLRPFELEVVAYDPHVSAARAAELGVTLVDLDEIFRTCDVVSLHAPLLPETTGLIGAPQFAAMKSGATFINTARGAIVREAELIEVLTTRSDLTAVLDVTWPEPPARGSPLYTLPNVVLTPHIAGALHGECRRLGQLMIGEFDRWLRGEPLQHAVESNQAAERA